MNCDPREPTVLPNPLSRRSSSAVRAPIAAGQSDALAYLKVDPKLRFLKLSMVAADGVLDENLWCFCLFAFLRNE